MAEKTTENSERAPLRYRWDQDGDDSACGFMVGPVPDGEWVRWADVARIVGVRVPDALFKQESLGGPFQTVLMDNLESLYVTAAPRRGARTAKPGLSWYAISPSGETYRAMAEEYMELMAHMDAGGDYMEFMAKRQHKDTK
jgi:hypothetical protein